MTNAINPSHYKSGNIECIDAMKACSTPEEFRGHLKLTVLKYLWREDKKGEGDQARVENLEKAAWYLDRLVRDLRGDDVKGAAFTLDASCLEIVPHSESIPPHTINAGDQGWVEWTPDAEAWPAGDLMVQIAFDTGPYENVKPASFWWWGRDTPIRRYRVVK